MSCLVCRRRVPSCRSCASPPCVGYNAIVNSEIFRIIDANLNRGREALRVLEEYARFVLDDVALTRRAKTLRHGLADVARSLLPAAASPHLLQGEASPAMRAGPPHDACGSLPSHARDESPNDAQSNPQAAVQAGVTRDGDEGLLLAARDIRHDVGTEVTTAAEHQRADAAAVAAAAAKRASEALRCIEEYGKTISPATAARVERLRYDLYALEQDVLLTGPRRRRLRQACLYVLVTQALCKEPWLSVCEQALVGGADVLQLREKALRDRELLARARQLRALTERHGALLIINDRPDVARLVGADGVHVGQDDLPVSLARQIAGGGRLVGTSTHSLDEARNALKEQPDYIAVGPMFTSNTKPDVPVQGPSLLHSVSAFSDAPVVAIGGITPENVCRLQSAGPLCVAVCQAVIASPDVTSAARRLKQQLSGQD